MTLLEMESAVREMLLDNFAGSYRWSSVFILNSLYEGVQLLFQLRPESRYSGLDLVKLAIPVVTAQTLSTEQAKTLYIDPRWNRALIYYAAGKCLEVDSADTANAQRSTEYLSQFNNLAKL